MQSELRLLTTFTVVGGAAAATEVIFPAQNQQREIIEIVAQPAVDTSEVTEPVSIQVLVNQTPQTPPWSVLGGGTLSDPGFTLESGSTISLLCSKSGADRNVSVMVRYRSAICTPEDTAVRRTIL